MNKLGYISLLAVPIGLALCALAIVFGGEGDPTEGEH